MTERDIDRHETEVFTQIEGSEDYPEGVEEPPLTAEDVSDTFSGFWISCPEDSRFCTSSAVNGYRKFLRNDAGEDAGEQALWRGA